MPIINTTPPPPRIVVEANSHKAQIRRQFNELSRLATIVFAWVWTSKDHTPQEAFDAFGTDAADLLKVVDAFNAMTTAYFGAPAIQHPPGVTVTPNQDGTVTVTVS